VQWVFSSTGLQQWSAADAHELLATGAAGLQDLVIAAGASIAACYRRIHPL